MELRNGVLRDYKISYSEYDSASQQFKEWYHQKVRATGGLESTVLNNLRPATQYIVEIRASTMAGMGPAFSAPLFSTLAEGICPTTYKPFLHGRRKLKRIWMTTLSLNDNFFKFQNDNDT